MKTYKTFVQNLLERDSAPTNPYEGPDAEKNIRLGRSISSKELINNRARQRGEVPADDFTPAEKAFYPRYKAWKAHRLEKSKSKRQKSSSQKPDVKPSPEVDKEVVKKDRMRARKMVLRPSPTNEELSNAIREQGLNYPRGILAIQRNGAGKVFFGEELFRVRPEFDSEEVLAEINAEFDAAHEFDDGTYEEFEGGSEDRHNRSWDVERIILSRMEPDGDDDLGENKREEWYDDFDTIARQDRKWHADQQALYANRSKELDASRNS